MEDETTVVESINNLAANIGASDLSLPSVESGENLVDTMVNLAKTLGMDDSSNLESFVDEDENPMNILQVCHMFN